MARFVVLIAALAAAACTLGEECPTQGATRCNGNETERCNGGSWVSVADATDCVAPVCGTENATRCTGVFVQRCVSGAWVSEANCNDTSAVCVDASGTAACEVPQTGCSNGAMRCFGSARQTCVSDQWQTDEDCALSSMTCDSATVTCAAAGVCPDSAYTETLDNSADISAWDSGYDPSGWEATALGVLAARYPVGHYIVDRARIEDTFLDCLDEFTDDDRNSFSDLVNQLGTAVHECGHGLDFVRSDFGRSNYVIRDDLEFALTEHDWPDRDVILQYTETWDSYANVYLVQTGAQGFEVLIEEFVQYINSLLTGFAFEDYVPNGVSVSRRDGILTFMYYLELYLMHVRINDTIAYENILGDSEWREFLLTIWGRAELALELTDSMPHLGINDSQIESLMRQPAMLAEIQALRDRHGCQ